LEASRLARNNRDWHHLIDLCALTWCQDTFAKVASNLSFT
jgi:hypothetical protein